MQTHFNALKHLVVLAVLLLMATAPLQHAHSSQLGDGKISGTVGGKGGKLRDTPDEVEQAAEDSSQAQDEAGGDPTAEASDEAEPEATSNEATELTDESEESVDEDEDAVDEDE